MDDDVFLYFIFYPLGGAGNIEAASTATPFAPFGNQVRPHNIAPDENRKNLKVATVFDSEINVIKF